MKSVVVGMVACVVLMGVAGCEWESSSGGPISAACIVGLTHRSSQAFRWQVRVLGVVILRSL